MFESPPFSGPSQTGLDLVTDKQCAVGPAKDLGLNKKIVLRRFDSFTQDRLHQKSGDILSAQESIERRQVTHLHPLNVVHQWTEAFLKIRDTGYREGSISCSVISTL